MGYDGEGRLLAARVTLVSDGGWSLDLSQPILDRALFHLDNAYYIPAVHFTGRVAKTNTTSHTAFRGFGGPQGMLVIEEIMDRIARPLGLPPEEVRARNLYRGSGRDQHDPLRPGDRRQPAASHVARRCRTRRASTRGGGRSTMERGATPRVKRGLAMTRGEVRDLLHPLHVQPGRRPGR